MFNFWNNIFGNKLPTVEYCEQALNSIIARPGYFISNLGYIFVGIYLFLRNDKLAKIFGVISIIVGTASALYDASFTFTSQIIDLLSMFFLINFLFLLNLYYLGIKNKITLMSLGILFQLSYFISILLLEGSSGRIFFGLFVLLVIVSEYILYRRRTVKNLRYFILALITFILGFLIWMLDSNLILCSPIPLFNGRAIFHYITSISIYYLYLHSRNKFNVLD